MATKLRVYFRNIVLFVQRSYGTDAWFVDTHMAQVFTAAQAARLRHNVVRIHSKGSPLVDHKTTLLNPNLIVNFKDIYPEVELSPEVTNKKLASGHLARVELRGVGFLRGPVSGHSHGAVINWTIPKVGGGAIVRRMTELAVYEVDVVEPPVTVAVLDQSALNQVAVLEVPETEDYDGSRVAEVFFEATEKQPDRSTSGDYELEEFTHMRLFFDKASAVKLDRSIPTGRRPTRLFEQLTADPFCPNGRVDFSDR